MWQVQKEDRDLRVNTLAVLQSIVSIVLSCLQVQTWLAIIAKDLSRDGLNGMSPLEIRKLIEANLTDVFEQSHQEWWKMINFTYEESSNVITT